MRWLRIAVALAATVALSTAVTATPARAGGWATTILDPLPERIESGHTYTVGFWVLQHGSHPYEGDLGVVGLRLVGPDAKPLTYRGVALPEPAHFAAAIAVPANGAWQVFAIQGVFADYEIGTLAVPGRIDPNPTPTPMAMDNHQHTWGLIRPPVALAAAGAPLVAPTATAQTSARTGTISRSHPTSPPLLGAAAAGIVVARLATLLLLARRRAHHHTRA
jgi:hypothetical protein